MITTTPRKHTVQRRFKVLNARPATSLQKQNNDFYFKDNVHNKFKKYNARFSNISSGQAIGMTLIYYNIEEMPISVVVIHQMAPLRLTV